MENTILLACLVLLISGLTTGVAFATTYTIPAGSGTLSFTAVETQESCTITLTKGRGETMGTYYYYIVNCSSFSYTVSGTTFPLPGGDYFVSPTPLGGLKGVNTPVTFYAPPDLSLFLSARSNF